MLDQFVCPIYILFIMSICSSYNILPCCTQQL